MRISDWSSDVCSSDLDCRLAGIGRAGDAIIIFDHLKIGIIIIEGREVCPKPPVEEGRFQAHLIAPNIFRKKGPPVAQLESARFEPTGCRCITHDISGNIVSGPAFWSPGGQGGFWLAGIELISVQQSPHCEPLFPLGVSDPPDQSE